jgi:hypothetical protein
LFFSHSWANDVEHTHVIEIPEDSLIACNGESSLNNPSDTYLEAYIQGVIDAKYPRSKVIAAVRNGEIVLKQLPKDNSGQDIVNFVKATTKRSVRDEKPIVTLATCQPSEKPKEWHGIWLPQSTILFPTQVANPRQICFAVGGRFRDKIAGPFASEVVLGGQFPIYRWANIYKGDLQLELEGGVFGIFNLRDQSFPLVNTDYYVGIPVTYAKGNWAFRARPYHVSTHLGDEYLLDHHHINRKNRSYEAFDVSADYSVSQHLRVYGVAGSILFSDREMPMSRAYIEYGFEARGPRSDFRQLFGQPFLAVHMRNWQEVHFAEDVSYALGYEWGKINGIGRKIRLFAEYHQGFSPDGQFCKKRTRYFGIRLAYGFQTILTSVANPND